MRNLLIFHSRSLQDDTKCKSLYYIDFSLISKQKFIWSRYVQNSHISRHIPDARRSRADEYRTRQVTRCRYRYGYLVASVLWCSLYGIRVRDVWARSRMEEMNTRVSSDEVEIFQIHSYHNQLWYYPLLEWGDHRDLEDNTKYKDLLLCSLDLSSSLRSEVSVSRKSPIPPSSIFPDILSISQVALSQRTQQNRYYIRELRSE